MRPFELGVVIIFIVLAMTALIMLAGFQGRGGADSEDIWAVGAVEIWGVLPQKDVQTVLSQLVTDNESYRNVKYRYIPSVDFDAQLVTALADQEGPDLVLMSHEKLVEMRKRIQPLSYETFPLRDIKSSYADGAEIFAMADGVYALPVAIDPLMMYWNRDILTTEGFLQAPATWEVLVNTVFPEVIQRDFDRTVHRSVVAMGEYNNVRNGFGILSMLLAQSGSGFVDELENFKYSVRLQQIPGGEGDPFRTSVEFYSRFSQPSNALYSWNRSLQEDRLEFVAEDLALYFGYASEGPDIERMNPNLNFDIAEVPQGERASVRRTYGRIYGLSLLRSASNPNGAYAIMQHLAAQPQADQLAIASDMAPVYRSSLTAGSNDKYGRVAYQSASVALGWLNPDVTAVDGIFATMTTDISENRRSIQGAISDASGRLADSY